MPSPNPGDSTAAHSDTATTVELTKHHGLGNDFLVALSPVTPVGPEEARAWCDRHTGFGADGLLVSEPGDSNGQWSMALFNADGGRAEISGNGLRCLGQAIAMRLSDNQNREPVSLAIETDAGGRELTVRPADGSTWSVTAAMGTARPGQHLAAGWDQTVVTPNHQVSADIGNPHLVAVVDSVENIDMATVGPVIEAEYPGGMNVHCIAVSGRDALDLVVWERGVGVTQACGSGACAAAWAARELGLVDDKIAVTMPGGSATVVLDGDDIELTGPATYIGKVLVG